MNRQFNHSFYRHPSQVFHSPKNKHTISSNHLTLHEKTIKEQITYYFLRALVIIQSALRFLKSSSPYIKQYSPMVKQLPNMYKMIRLIQDVNHEPSKKNNKEQRNNEPKKIKTTEPILFI